MSFQTVQRLKRANRRIYGRVKVPPPLLELYLTKTTEGHSKLVELVEQDQDLVSNEMIVPFEGYLKSNGLVSFIILFYYTGTLKTEPCCYLKLAVKCPSSLREDSGVGAQSNRWREGYGRRREKGGRW